MITSRTVSSLEKIFHDSEPTCASLSEMSMLGNERASFQLAYFSDEDTQCGISVSGWRPENIRRQPCGHFGAADSSGEGEQET